MRRLIGWRGLGLWALLVAALLACALLKRHVELLRLGDALAAQLTPVAEQGAPGAAHDDWEDPELDLYLYGDWSGPQSIQASQGPAIFLFNHGYRNPALLRAVLLLEARRCYDWQYTYSRVRNYDLRAGLIRRCLKRYPDGLRVYWAAGQLELAAGDWEAAALHLGRVVQACGSMEALRSFGESIGRKGRNILGRYCAALTLCGRDAEAGALLKEWNAADENDRDVNWAYSHWLLDNGEYQAVLDLLTAPDSPQRPAPTFDAGIVSEAALAASSSTEFDPSRIGELRLGLEEAVIEDALVPEDWQRIEARGQERVRRLLELSRGLLALGRREEAREALDLLGQNLMWDEEKSSQYWLLELELYLAGEYMAVRRADNAIPPAEPDLPPAGEEGWLQQSLDGDAAVAFLRSPAFDAALARRGVTFEQLKPELYAAIQPQRDNYYDMSNGKLRAGAL